MTPSGMIETSTDNVYLRYSGIFDDENAVKNTPIQANGKTFYLGDIATVERRYAEPGDTTMYYNGQPAVGIAVSMEDGGNIITLGNELKTAMTSIQSEMTAGLEIHQVSDQPKVVEESIDDFVSTL